MFKRNIKLGVTWIKSIVQNDFQVGIAQNSLIVLLGHLARLMLGIISSALVARGLGPEGLSVYSIILAMMSIGNTVADFGLSNSAIQQIAGRVVGMYEGARRTAGVYARYKLLGGLIVFGIILLFPGFFTTLIHLPRETDAFLFQIASLGLLSMTLSGIFGSILHALSNFRSFIASQIFNSALVVLFTLILYFTQRIDIAHVLLVGAVATLATAGLRIFQLPIEWRATIWAKSKMMGVEGRKLLSFSKWMGVSAIFSILSIQLDLLLLNWWVEPQIVGYYALALNLYFKVDIVNQSVHSALFPVAAVLSSKKAYAKYIRQSLLRSLLLAIFIILILPFARPVVIVIYGIAYSPAVDIFYFLMVTMVFELFFTPLILLIYPMNLPRVAAMSDVLRVVSLFAMGSLLIPVWGIYGAAIAKLVSRVSGALFTMVVITVRFRGIEKLTRGSAT